MPGERRQSRGVMCAGGPGSVCRTAVVWVQIFLAPLDCGLNAAGLDLP